MAMARLAAGRLFVILLALHLLAVPAQAARLTSNPPASIVFFYICFLKLMYSKVRVAVSPIFVSFVDAGSFRTKMVEAPAFPGGLPGAEASAEVLDYLQK